MANNRKGIARQALTDRHGIDFKADFFTLNSQQVEALTDNAKAWGYRKPRNANGSTARYFFAYLNREPKTQLVYVVQGNYAFGWEDLTESDDYREARDDLRAYRLNDPAPTRLIKRRVKLESNQ